mmetsp:Transcript_102298/g.305455  ORF Transcript_102298/g.305455 Transcript_102298/m.305455 type:complete len:103 (+) Transcript_102298:87-395(+)|eukprot:CAMPEP_0175262244 /NCGR_PEP_ID=MMETSP0093-20121207/41170_1 /TAXON_ID=311494 /ORGANISM="Alexandrium monilatum, Strain CCMP3105" /LENGTH=102 /DNA_ID=CAMNT_0016556717 /DNA_START=82 /DNA_END=390 /DNA_ORIENTATION=-
MMRWLRGILVLSAPLACQGQLDDPTAMVQQQAVVSMLNDANGTSSASSEEVVLEHHKAASVGLNQVKVQFDLGLQQSAKRFFPNSTVPVKAAQAGALQGMVR